MTKQIDNLKELEQSGLKQFCYVMNADKLSDYEIYLQYNLANEYLQNLEPHFSNQKANKQINIQLMKDQTLYMQDKLESMVINSLLEKRPDIREKYEESTDYTLNTEQQMIEINKISDLNLSAQLSVQTMRYHVIQAYFGKNSPFTITDVMTYNAHTEEYFGKNSPSTITDVMEYHKHRCDIKIQYDIKITGSHKQNITEDFFPSVADNTMLIRHNHTPLDIVVMRQSANPLDNQDLSIIGNDSINSDND